MSTLEDRILEALNRIEEPAAKKSIVAMGLIQNLAVSEGSVSFTLDAATQPEQVRQQLKDACEKVLAGVEGVTDTMIMLSPARKVRENPLTTNAPGLAGVRHIVAVSSCKGGVGKSTVAVNLAYSLAGQGHKVGIFDADIYGPSLPTMVQIEDAQVYQQDDMIVPLAFMNVKLMSFGYIPSAAGNAAIMRGPMVTQIINQLLTTTNWGELDYLILDLPPGTGDVQLTLTQLIPITAAVIVTTPQQLSFVDVVKGIQMFDKLKVPTVAIVENMSYFKCPGCGTEHRLFGRGARQRIVDQYGIRNAFDLPVVTDLSTTGDGGLPYVLAQPKAETAVVFRSLAEAVEREIDVLKKADQLRPDVEFVPGQGIMISRGEKRGSIPPAELRRKCRCAACVEEFSGRQILKPEDIADHVYPVRMQPMGNYAVAVQWSDGHSSSIYPYETLIELAGLG